MESQSQGSSESLGELFMAFARPLLAQLEQWEAAGNVPQFPSSLYHPRRGPPTRFETHYKYGILLQKYFWTSLPNKEAERCVRALWEAGILRYPVSQLLPDDLAFIRATARPSDQVVLELTRELMLPIFDLLDRYKTYQLTNEQLLERFAYFQCLWRSPVIQWEVTFPLINFDSDLQQEYPIGSRLRLAPLTKEEQDDSGMKPPFRSPGSYMSLISLFLRMFDSSSSGPSRKRRTWYLLD